jgi:hypothetical protein
VDSDTFDLHVEFVHAHGVPKGQFTTFSTCNHTEPVAGQVAAVELDSA